MSNDPREWISYDENTGRFFVKKLRPSQNKNKIGDEVGAIVDGRFQIKTGGVKYARSRLAWFFIFGEFPDGVIEHINGNVLDDRASNLRNVTRSCVSRKIETNKRNSTGYAGVSFHKKSGKYSAQVRMDGKNYYLGLYDDPKEASIARLISRDFLFGKDFVDIK